MIEFVTVDGDRVWVPREKVLLITQAKSNDNGKAIPMLGITMVQVDGPIPPLYVRGNPSEVVLKVEVGNVGIRSSLSA